MNAVSSKSRHTISRTGDESVLKYLFFLSLRTEDENDPANFSYSVPNSSLLLLFYEVYLGVLCPLFWFLYLPHSLYMHLNLKNPAYI